MAYDALVLISKVESVSAINSKTIEVKFSTPVTKVSAETSTQVIAKITPYGAMTVASKSLSADGKTLVITVTTDMIDAPNGYTWSVAKDLIQSVDGQKLAATERIFSGSALADTIAPAVVTAQYDSTNNKLNLTFNKNINRTVANVDATKFTIKGAGDGQSVVLTAAAYTTSATPGNTLALTVPVAVASYTAPITLELAANAVMDTNVPAIKNAAASYKVEPNEAPKVASSTYDELSDKLTITLNKTVSVKAGDYDLSKIKIVRNGAQLALAGTAVLETSVDGSVLVVNNALVNQRTTALTTVASLKVDAAAFKDLSAQTNPAQTAATLTYTDDVTPPSVASASFNNLSSLLTLTFSEKVNTSAMKDGVFTINAVPVVFGGGTPNAVLNTNVASNTMIIKLSNTASGAALTEIVKANAQLNVLNGQLADPTGNTNKTALAVGVTLQDQTRPKFSTPAAATVNNQITVNFNKEMASNIGTAANYTIKDVETGSTILAVSNVEVLPYVAGAATHDVILTTAIQNGILYKVEVANVTDKSGNLINGPVAVYDPTSSPTNNDNVFLGAAGIVDLTGPTISTAKLVDVDSNNAVNKGDQITVYFDKRVQTTTFTMADFAVSDSKILGTTADPATFSIAADQSKCQTVGTYA